MSVCWPWSGMGTSMLVCPIRIHLGDFKHHNHPKMVVGPGSFLVGGCWNGAYQHPVQPVGCRIRSWVLPKQHIWDPTDSSSNLYNYKTYNFAWTCFNTLNIPVFFGFPIVSCELWVGRFLNGSWLDHSSTRSSCARASPCPPKPVFGRWLLGRKRCWLEKIWDVCQLGACSSSYKTYKTIVVGVCRGDIPIYGG